MKNIGMLKGILLCLRYQKMSEKQKEEIRDKRLKQMVAWAKEKSPYYAKLYTGLKENYELTDLQPVNKVDLMTHFDEWITDSEITLEEINAFMENPDNIGRRLNGKYYVFTTSGSTGNPLVALCDKTTNSMMGAINALRTFARREDLKKFILRGGKTIGVFATGGFYLACSSVRARQLMMPWKKRQIAVTSALLPLHQIVDELNQFQPVMLGGYPSNLELLIEEQKKGNLHITPTLIMTGGEYLSAELQKRLSETFCCYVQTSYACTEGGTIACECVNRHFHINDDWIIVEPVDKNNQPVKDGELSDKILITNLFNYTQPYIRYEVTDRVVMHHEACGCGNSSPWLTLEGRTDDVVIIHEGESEIKLAPLAIYATLKEVHEVRRFQLIVHHPGNQAELRIEPVDGVNQQEAFMKACEALRKFLLIHGVHHMELRLAEEMPMQHSRSGKFKHIICEKT